MNKKSQLFLVLFISTAERLDSPTVEQLNRIWCRCIKWCMSLEFEYCFNLQWIGVCVGGWMFYVYRRQFQLKDNMQWNRKPGIIIDEHSKDAHRTSGKRNNEPSSYRVEFHKESHSNIHWQQKGGILQSQYQESLIAIRRNVFTLYNNIMLAGRMFLDFVRL